MIAIKLDEGQVSPCCMATSRACQSAEAVARMRPERMGALGFARPASLGFEGGARGHDHGLGPWPDAVGPKPDTHPICAVFVGSDADPCVKKTDSLEGLVGALAAAAVYAR
mgnify:FL=1